ncbi:MAG: hypothetical protein ACXABC_02130 [Candidatus Thorarchaeota archaeon]|jgi:hypothetical protein
MDKLLQHAKGLYKDRQRIALATILIAFSVTLWLFYSSGIYGLGIPPEHFPPGWASGLEVAFSFNTVGFILAFALMVFAYGFWSWAFLPSPAAAYTVGVLKGLFGSKAEIKQLFGKRFRVLYNQEHQIDITCRIGGGEPQDWFIYRLRSCSLSGDDLDDIALRHGMSIKDQRFTTWISNDELHSRTLLLVKAMAMVSS